MDFIFSVVRFHNCRCWFRVQFSIIIIIMIIIMFYDFVFPFFSLCSGHDCTPVAIRCFMHSLLHSFLSHSVFIHKRNTLQQQTNFYHYFNLSSTWVGLVFPTLLHLYVTLHTRKPKRKCENNKFDFKQSTDNRIIWNCLLKSLMCNLAGENVKFK